MIFISIFVGIEEAKCQWDSLKWIVLLVAKLLGQDNFLLTLNVLDGPLATLDNSVDGLLLFFELRDLGRLLVLQLVFELGKKLDIA
jgi:hypothetical protein